MNFRGDINALRAITVIFVVGFHYGIQQHNTWFVRVDILFILSGYLMAKFGNDFIIPMFSDIVYE